MEDTLRVFAVVWAILLVFMLVRTEWSWVKLLGFSFIGTIYTLILGEMVVDMLGSVLRDLKE